MITIVKIIESYESELYLNFVFDFVVLIFLYSCLLVVYGVWHRPEEVFYEELFSHVQYVCEGSGK